MNLAIHGDVNIRSNLIADASLQFKEISFIIFNFLGFQYGTYSKLSPIRKLLPIFYLHKITISIIVT